MSSPAHLIVSADNPQITSLADIIRDFKKFTAGQLIREIEAGLESRQEWLLYKFQFAASKNSRNTTYKFWQQNNHAEELLSNSFTDQKLQYIHLNPVQEGWVEEAHHYIYRSAWDYNGFLGLVPITFLG